MNEAVGLMLERYSCHSLEEYLLALREIFQEIALLGLWRSKFFEKAAFYGGTALRILYGLDRFSEDLDFSLLAPAKDFHLPGYTTAVHRELSAFGFDVRVEQRQKGTNSAVQSAFLKANTLSQLLVIRAPDEIARQVHREQMVKIKLEVDTDPPPAFNTELRYLLQPIPFAVRICVLPDLFAGKMHAVLCQRWKSRSKGRDWYDFIWYAAHHPQLHLYHLEQRMRQSGDWTGNERMSREAFRQMLNDVIDGLDVDQARKEVERFVSDPASLAIWSRAFFKDVADRILPV